MRNIKYYIPGSILILIAIVIIAVPQILVAFLAASIIMAGVGALCIGHIMRKSEIELKNVDGWFSKNDSFGRPFVWTSVFRRWH